MAIDLPFPSDHPGGSTVRRLSTWAWQAAPPLVTALAYFVAAKVGAWLAFPSAPVSALWAPNAILLAALLLARRERWWLYLLVVLPFHFAVQWPDTPLAQIAIQYVANSAEAVLGAWAIVRLCPFPRRFDRLRTVVVLVLVGGIVAPFVTSLLMVGGFAVAAIPAEPGLTVVVRTITNTFAIVALVPLIVHAVTRVRSGPMQAPLWHLIEAIALGFALASVCLVVFGAPRGDSPGSIAWVFLPLPLLAWATIRFRVAGACSAALIVGAIS
jgi:integral membrane sensor domain MASE1